MLALTIVFIKLGRYILKIDKAEFCFITSIMFSSRIIVKFFNLNFNNINLLVKTVKKFIHYSLKVWCQGFFLFTLFNNNVLN